ncbi:MAG: TonB-dependent receptor [Saprospiraceae bacterium]
MKYLACLMILGTSIGLFAQQELDSLWIKSMDQVVITAQFTPTDTRQTVNTVRILNRKTIEQRGVVNLQELLQTEANIRIAQDPILGSDISVNGLKGENLKILIDGVPIVGRLNGNIDAGQIPLNYIQKVEIIEGAQSLLYGSEASGGVINLITRKSQLKSIDTEVNTQYETNGFRNLSARLGYSANKFTIQASGNIQEFVPLTDTIQGRDQLWNPKRQKSARGMFRYSPSEDFDIRLTGNILSEQVDNLGDIKRPVFKPYAFDDYYMTDRQDISLFSEKWTKSRDLIQMTIGWNAFSRIKNSYRLDFDNESKSLLEGMQDTSSAHGILTRFTYASERKERKWSYILGAENYYENATGTRLFDTTSTIPGQAYTNDLGVFASGKIKLHNELTIQSGARWTNNMRYGNAVTPSTWLLWQPKLPFQTRLSWAYGFRSPSVKELFFNFVDINHFVIGNPDLKPERSVNLRGEITWKTLSFEKTNVSVTTTGFYNKVTDRIILTALGPVHYEYRNVNQWMTKGGSIRLQANIGEWLRFQTDVISTGFHNTNADQNSDTGQLWSTDWANDLTIVMLKGKMSWNIWHKYTGKTPFFYNEDGKSVQGSTDAWNMLNSGISTQILEKKLMLNFGVKNIFDIRQLQANNNNGIHIEASNQQNLHWGRNVYVGVIYQWQN